MSTTSFRLIDHNWSHIFETAVALNASDLLIVSPFIKLSAVKRLTKGQTNIRVLTRFSLHDLFEGVSDLSALEHLLSAGAQVRGIKNLHAKLYVFGDKQAIVTSANLTGAALTRNHELGFVANETIVLDACRAYFDRLWDEAGKQTGSTLTPAMVADWRKRLAKITESQKGGAVDPTPPLEDFGANLGFMPDAPPVTMTPTISQQAFVKFFGEGNSRSNLTSKVIDEVKSSESHWSLSYPGGKRPRQAQTGDVMFIAQMVEGPNDMRIFGRAVAYAHQPGRDDASNADITRTPWKKTWCHYIRVRDPEFVSGTLANGISLDALMTKFGAETFTSTSASIVRGFGNTNPRKAFQQQAQVRLTSKAANWLNAEFNRALVQHGRIPTSELEQLYWPELPC